MKRSRPDLIARRTFNVSIFFGIDATFLDFITQNVKLTRKKTFQGLSAQPCLIWRRQKRVLCIRRACFRRLLLGISVNVKQNKKNFSFRHESHGPGAFVVFGSELKKPVREVRLSGQASCNRWRSRLRSFSWGCRNYANLIRAPPWNRVRLRTELLRIREFFSWHSQLWKEKRQAGLRRLQPMINYRISTLISAGSISNRRPFCVASQRAENLLLSICDKFRLAPTNSDQMAGVTYLPACSFNIIHRFTRNLRARRLKIDGINSLNWQTMDEMGCCR